MLHTRKYLRSVFFSHRPRSFVARCLWKSRTNPFSFRWPPQLTCSCSFSCNWTSFSFLSSLSVFRQDHHCFTVEEGRWMSQLNGKVMNQWDLKLKDEPQSTYLEISSGLSLAFLWHSLAVFFVLLIGGKKEHFE